MAAAPDDDNTFDGSVADEARFPGAPVNPVLKLKEALFAVSVDVVGNRRTAQRDCFLENFLDGAMQAFQLCARNGAGPATGTKAGTEQRFIRVDVADTAQELLVQERALDRSPAPAKKRDEFSRIDFQGFASAGLEITGTCNTESPETARIHKAQFTARRELHNGVGMLDDFGFRIANRASGLSCRGAQSIGSAQAACFCSLRFFAI